MIAEHFKLALTDRMELIRSFQRELRQAAAETGQDPTSLALIVAQMRLAARLLSDPGPPGMGFLEAGRELTAQGWQAMLARLASVWPRPWPAPTATFAFDPQSLPPGYIERLRRLALSIPLSGSHAESNPAPVRGWIRYALLSPPDGRHFAAPAVPSFELCQLIANAADLADDQQVYCAYGMTAAVAMHIAEVRPVQVTLDIPEAELAALCACLAVVDDLPLTVRERDPLLSPVSVDEDFTSESAAFDVAIVFPPFGMRSRGEDYRNFGTNLPQPGSPEGQYVALALARGRRAAVCLLPTGFLFRTTKADQAFKERSIRLFGLDAVVGLPRDAILWSSSIQAALLIYRPRSKAHTWMPHQRHVLMIDGRQDRESDRLRDTESPMRELSSILQQRAETEISVLASADEIAGHDFNLSIERYVLDPETRRARDLLARSEAVPLEDVADITRPQALLVGRERGGRESRLAPDLPDQSPDILLEVGVGDIDDAGIVRTPTTSVPASFDLLQRAKRARLEPGDVLIVIKGSVGKVGLVREIPEGPAWLASQSFAILRLRRRGPIIDPAVLFRFLSSSMGQVTVQSLKVGSVISGLQMADLRRLPVLVPSTEAQRAIASQMHAIFNMQNEIQRMRRELIDRQQFIWPEMDRTSFDHIRNRPR